MFCVNLFLASLCVSSSRDCNMLSLFRWFTCASSVAFNFYSNFSCIYSVFFFFTWLNDIIYDLLFFSSSLLLMFATFHLVSFSSLPITSHCYRQCPLGMQRRRGRGIFSFFLVSILPSCISHAYFFLSSRGHQVSSVSLCQKLLATQRVESKQRKKETASIETASLTREEEEKNGQKSRSFFSSKLLLCKFYFQPLNKVDKFYLHTSLFFSSHFLKVQVRCNSSDLLPVAKKKKKIRQDNCALFLMAWKSDSSRFKRWFFTFFHLISHSLLFFLLIALVSFYRLWRRH